MANVEVQVAHIWRRLGFGPQRNEIISGVALGPTALVDALVDRAYITATDALPQGPNQQENDNLRRVLELMSFGPVTRGAITTSPNYNPVQERLSWMMQGLLVVGMDVATLSAMRDHLTFVRSAIRSTYKQLLLTIATRPGMLRYLTGDQNVVGHPNLNFARECMELFSLGREDLVTGTPNYTEEEIEEVARACTGWRYNWQTGGSYFDSGLWDPGSKTFLGASRGAAGIPELVNAIAQQPSWPRFVPARVYRELTGFTATPQVLSELAPAWGYDGNLKNLVRAIGKRTDFLSDACILNRTKSPVERLVAATRLLQWPGLQWEPDIDWLLRNQGQHPFYPPNVSGWPRGDQWLSTASLQSWNRLANAMAMRGINSQGIVVGTVCPTVDLVYNNATGATAADYVLARAGLKYVTSTRTWSALDSYARAGLWNRARAAGVLNLLLVSPEFLAN